MSIHSARILANQEWPRKGAQKRAKDLLHGDPKNPARR
jgi:hypothetical protein